MFGVELQANAINSLLTARLINDGGSAGITVWLSLLAVLCSVGGAIAIVRVRRTDLAAMLGAGLALGFPLVLTMVAFSAFDAPDGTLLPMATPLKVWLIVSLSAFAFASYRGRPAQAPAEMREQHSDSGTGSQPIRDQSSIELVAELRGAREAEPDTPSRTEGGSSVTMPEDTSRPAKGWGAILMATALVGVAYISGIGRDKE
jgi:hypothetical protein